ncbi:hypothetical protein [Sphingomonas sp. CLY1604]|uniref:hypothetical protein n=1 Tax=Sphingomonas sp. CLY1604 TaxID=3457786 RepID=UPI003FD7D343
MAVYCSFPHPIRDQVRLEAIAAESRHLLAIYPLRPTDHSQPIPHDKWPVTIAELKPYSVFVRHGMIDITTKPFFDGGWGYGFTSDRRNLTMLDECWSDLGHNVYWHGPC